MAKKKASGAASQQTTRPGKRLGIKIYGGDKVKVGQIIVRQRGTKYHSGPGTKLGRDHTLFAMKDGTVKFNKSQQKTYVEVV